MKKTILILVCAVLTMALLGWLTFAYSPYQTTINIETHKIKSDTQRAIQEGEKALDEVSRQSQELLKKHPDS